MGLMTRMGSIFYQMVTFLISKAIILIKRVTTKTVVSTTMTMASTSHPQKMTISLITMTSSAAQTMKKRKKKTQKIMARILKRKSIPIWKMAQKKRPPTTMVLMRLRRTKVSGESIAFQLSSGSRNSLKTKST